MFNWFRKKEILSDFDKFIKIFDLELQNILKILQNCDIIYIAYEGHKIIYTFSNSFILDFGEYSIKVTDKNTGNTLYYFSYNSTTEYYKKRLIQLFNTKSDQYRNNIAIYNENFNVAKINTNFSSEYFYFELAKSMRNINLYKESNIANELWHNGSYNEDGQTFKEAVLKGLFELMKVYYGENRLLEKIVEVGSNEQ